MAELCWVEFILNSLNPILNEFSSWYSTWCSTKFLSQKWSSTHKMHIDVFVTFMCISCIIRFWQWNITWCFVFTFSIKIISRILRLSYLMSCEFLSWKKSFLALTTCTVTQGGSCPALLTSLRKSLSYKTTNSNGKQPSTNTYKNLTQLIPWEHHGQAYCQVKF